MLFKISVISGLDINSEQETDVSTSAKSDQSLHAPVSGTLAQASDTDKPDPRGRSPKAEKQLKTRLLALLQAAWLLSKMDPQPPEKRTKARSAKPDAEMAALRFVVIFFSRLVQPHTCHIRKRQL